MSYVVLARKYRPQRFRGLVGQEHVAITLLNALATHRMAHALLFTGTRGVGKTSAARILAKALNCENPQSGEPCNQCRNCRQVDSGSHLDVMEIDGASNSSVEDAKELQDRIGYPPTQGKYRIFIIDEVHMLSKAAFNSLLKTIEEPPPNLIFIFATTEVQKVPETILSRVQRFDFKRIYPQKIFQALKDICEGEKIPFEPSALSQLAEKADGSMRDALSLLDQVLAFSHQNLTLRSVQEALGLVDVDTFFRLGAAIQNRDRTIALRTVDDIFMRGADIIEFSEGLHTYFRNLLVVKTSPESAAGLGILPTHLAIFQKQAAAIDQKDILRFLEVLSGLMLRIAHSSFPKFDLEICLLTLIEMDNALDIRRFLTNLEQGNISVIPPSRPTSPAVRAPAPLSPSSPEPRPTNGSPATPDPGFEEPVAAVAAKPTSLMKPEALTEEVWRTWYEEMISDNAAAGIALSTSRLIKYDGTKLVLGFPRSIISFQVDQLKRRKNFNFLNEFFKSRLGHMPELEFTAIEEPGNISGTLEDRGDAGAVKKNGTLGRKARNVLEDPLVKSALEIFDGEIIG
jgi:DNA polymerase-3 subunit gamma/tau